MDFDFSHGVILLLFGSIVTLSRQELQMLTPAHSLHPGAEHLQDPLLGHGLPKSNPGKLPSGADVG
jgi:hypothetical protein